MEEFIVYAALIIVLTVTVCLLARNDYRRERRNASYWDAPIDFSDSRDAVRETSRSETADDESSTRRLIGDDAYERMVSRVDKLLRRHADDRSLTVSLTSGPDSEAGANELHSLLPGDSLWLRRCEAAEIDAVDVYARGRLVGRLMLAEAGQVERVMDHARITGCYVAEQNCYGDTPGVDLRLIVFFTCSGGAVSSDATLAALTSRGEYKVKIAGNGIAPFDLWQN